MQCVAVKSLKENKRDRCERQRYLQTSGVQDVGLLDLSLAQGCMKISANMLVAVAAAAAAVAAH